MAQMYRKHGRNRYRLCKIMFECEPELRKAADEAGRRSGGMSAHQYARMLLEEALAPLLDRPTHLHVPNPEAVERRVVSLAVPDQDDKREEEADAWASLA